MSNQNMFTTFEAPRKSLRPGVNEGVVIKDMKYEMTDKYEACAITYQQGDIEFTDKIFPVNPSWVTPYENESPEQALNRKWGEVNSKLKSIILNFTDEATFTAKISKAQITNFKEAVEFYTSFLPANYSTVPGRLFVWYKKNGYLEVPQLAKALKGNRLFSTDPSIDMSLTRPVDESKLTRPAQAGDVNQPAEATTPANADDLPW